MDTGLTTSDPTAWVPVAPTVVCRDCRAQLSVEESEDHDCSTAPPSPTKVMFLKTAARANSFIDAILDASSTPTTILPSKQDIPTPPDRANSAPQLPHNSENTKHVAVPERSISIADTSEVRSPAVTLPLPSTRPIAATDQQRRWVTSSSGVQNALLQCNVRNVRVTDSQFAVYALATRIPSLTASEITVERRFREFYVFAVHVCTMFPSAGLWKLLPPKTYCALRRQSTLEDGFLLRRQSGLQDFVHCALEKMVLGGEAQGTIATMVFAAPLSEPPSSTGHYSALKRQKP
ncbi:hypothetical protein ON010_g814 [Phytophthora cinnamomi]|nr:hypothetical protein ON010_g814 [Phytophthora cinnamomi]